MEFAPERHVSRSDTTYVSMNHREYKPIGKLYLGTHEDAKHDTALDISRYKSSYQASAPLFHSPASLQFRAGRGEAYAGVGFTLDLN